ncbi:MAG: hypothetical protein H7A24_09380 [Leptospiraceae bacterium]|nr:hypothetical protein [Leptospiraceae bacterium]
MLIKCPYCNFSFRMDPDDPSTFLGGRFELSKSSYTNQNTLQNKSLEIKDFILQNKKKLTKNLIVFLLFLLTFVHLYRFSKEVNLESNEPESIPSPVEEKPNPSPISPYEI